MTTEQPTEDPTTDPKEAAAAGPSGNATGDDLEPGSTHPLSADEGEPDVEPFAGDDDILSGHLDR